MMMRSSLRQRYASTRYLIIFTLLCAKNAISDNIDNNIMKMNFSREENKYLISLSGYNIENSFRHCALQYYGQNREKIEVSKCTNEPTNGRVDITSNMCIYKCKKVELNLSGEDFKTIKYIKWCQGMNEDDVKNCPTKKVFAIKDLYIKSSLTVSKAISTFTVSVQSKESRELTVKENLLLIRTQGSSTAFYTSKSIILHSKPHQPTYVVEVDNHLPEILLNPKNLDEDWFIATGSNKNNDKYYTITLQNPKPSQICYFGIKDINDSHFSSNCSEMKRAGPCLQPCYRATLYHDQTFNFAQILVKPLDKIISKEFIQTITFATDQPIITEIGKNVATLALTNLKKNEGEVTITEIKIIEKNLGIKDNWKKLTCDAECNNFQHITLSSLVLLTEYILKVKIKGLKTLDSLEVNYYHRYFYFKTKGDELTTSGKITPTTITDQHTKLTLSLSNSFSDENINEEICDLYYSLAESDTPMYPATCEGKKFCSGACNNDFNIINLDPKTNYKITVCPRGYTCVDSSATSTTGIELIIKISKNNQAKKTTVTLEASLTESSGTSWAYVLMEQGSNQIIKDCLNRGCNPAVSSESKTIDFSCDSLNFETTYKLVIINEDHSKPKEGSLECGINEGDQKMVIYYDKSAQRYMVKFNNDDLPNKTGEEYTVKKSNNNLSGYENAGKNGVEIKKNYADLSTAFEINPHSQNKPNYVSIAYSDKKTKTVQPKGKSGINREIIAKSGTGDEDSHSEKKTTTLGEKGNSSTSPSLPLQAKMPEIQTEVIFNVGKVYSYYIDHFKELTYSAKLDVDKIKLGLNKCSIVCKAFKDIQVQTLNPEKHSVNSQCEFESYSIQFDELVKDYYISCPEYFDFHYFYDNTFVRNQAPVFSRFYYELKNDKENNAFTVQLVNSEPSEMCTFEWLDATTANSTSFFSNECDNKENCFFSMCNSYKFENVNTHVKAVKIRVLKLGMKPTIGYQNNIHILEHGDDVPVATAGSNIQIDIRGKDKGEGGEDTVSSAVVCSLKFWNTYAPLVTETGRKVRDDSTTSCSFGKVQITPDPTHVYNDIMVTITNIPNYSLRKYFVHKITQTKKLAIEASSLTPTANGFTITESIAASTNICTIYVKEKKDLYYPAICSENVLCAKSCQSQFEIIGLNSGTTYGLKIVPSGDFDVKIFESQKTKGETIEFVISNNSKKNKLEIQTKNSLENVSDKKCYYQLYKHETDKVSPTRIIKSCIGCENDAKNCNDIKFDHDVYDNKYNYRLMIYADKISSPFKLSIPAFVRRGKLEQKFIKSSSDDAEKFSVTLKDFPDNNYCVIKIVGFIGAEFKKPQLCTDEEDGDCLVECTKSDLNVGYINSKIDRYISVCYGADKDEAKRCKMMQVFPIIMNYKQDNTYKISYTDGKVSCSYKSNSITDWNIQYDGKDVPHSDTDKSNMKMEAYSETPEDKSISLPLDRYIIYYNVSSTLLWPGILYYINNNYIKAETPLKSEIIYSVSGVDNDNRKLKIKFSPGPYNGEICHIKVFKVDESGSDQEDTVLNGCTGEKNECFHLCHDGFINMTEESDNVGIIVKRRFDTDGFKQHFKRNDNGIILSGISNAGVILTGLNVYKSMNADVSDSVCTIKIRRANTCSTETKAECKDNNECNTSCEESYTINNLLAGTSYIISVTVTNVGINNYVKKITFRTTGEGDLTANNSDPIKKGSTVTITPFGTETYFPVCRIYVKKHGTSDPKYMATCDEMGACENKCDAKFKIVNLDLGATYTVTVEPSDGKTQKEYSIEIMNGAISTKHSLHGYSDLTTEVNFDGKDENSRCPFMIQEKIGNDQEGKIVTWCNDDEECSANKCVVKINNLSTEKDYILKLKVKDHSLYRSYNIQYSRIGKMKGKLNKKSLLNKKFIEGENIRSEYANIVVNDIVQKVIEKVEKRLYAMIPIVTSLLVVMGIAVYKKNSKDASYDL